MIGRDRRRLGALVLAMLAGCKGAAPPPAPGDAAGGSARLASPIVRPVAPPAPAASAQAKTITFDEPKIALPRQESFQLLDAGKGNKAMLRYAFAPGTVSSTVETRLSSRHLEGADFTKPTALPAIRDGFAITSDAERSGRFALRALAGESAAKASEADAYLAQWRSLLQDRRIAIAIDDRGSVSTVAFDDDATGARSARAKDELLQRLLATIAPLPVEPVGTGASWRVVTILRQGPAYTKQTATYTLRARGATRWKLHVKLQRVGEEQRIADPSLPPGTTADLLALFRMLEGDVEVDPRYPLIVGGSLTIESRLHVRLEAPGHAATEHIFEDTGTAMFALCRPAPAAAATPASPGKSAPLAPCPDGFARGR